ncbi:glycosyltransferase [Akkermansiaceae bacterium]|nr:glycosyltransferase [Akkermansiaceae bacterium]
MAQLTKYLPDVGWTPQVICSEWTRETTSKFDPKFGGDAVRESVVGRVAPPRDLTTPKTLVDKVEKLGRLLAGYRNPKEWTAAVIAEGRQALRGAKVDVILATFPFRAALYAADQLSREFRIPWIADFRDVFEESTLKWRWGWERYNERRVLRSAALITTVSSALAEALRARHQQDVRILPNGFDPEDFVTQSRRETEKFTILYAGSLHPPGSHVRVSPKVLFQAVDYLAERGNIDVKDIELRFLGTTFAKLDAHLVDTGCRNLVRVDEWVSRSEVVAWEQGAHLLLLLGSDEMKGILTAKVFEYLAARRRILAIPSDGDCIDRLLARSGAGVSASSMEDVATCVADAYAEWKISQGVRCDSDEDVIAEYDRRLQSEILAAWMSEIAL